MKNVILILCLIFSIVSGAMAQDRPMPEQMPGRMKERIESYRIAFLTERLNLTPEQAEKFWPMYNQFTEQRKALRKSIAKKDVGTMTDAEVEKFLTETLSVEEKELALKKEYYQKLRGVINIRQLARLQRAEQEFKAQLLRKAKERRKGMKGGRGRMNDEG
ncbi:MAG: hypothetical protein RLZZ292_407 [Bacteroidota bacterium]|jgi:hypothetical protein